MINVKFKSKFDAKDLIRSVDRMLDQVKNKTYNTARSETPVRSGYAKSQWRKRDTIDGFRVSNAVDYIQFLDMINNSLFYKSYFIYFNIYRKKKQNFFFFFILVGCGF